MSTTLRRRLVEGPDSLGQRSRHRRWQALQRLFPDLPQLRVVDLGGTVDSWRRAPVAPAHVTVVNLEAQSPDPDRGIDVVAADACELDPATLPGAPDLVYSNSLLEHVGGHARRAQLAALVDRLAPRYWVQAPYRYFPVEPHWLFPGLQFLPQVARARLVQRWPLGYARPADFAAALAAVTEVELPSKTEMAAYFPDATLLLDTVGPLTKSLIAARGSDRLTDPAPRRGVPLSRVLAAAQDPA